MARTRTLPFRDELARRFASRTAAVQGPSSPLPASLALTSSAVSVVAMVDVSAARVDPAREYGRRPLLPPSAVGATFDEGTLAATVAWRHDPSAGAPRYFLVDGASRISRLFLCLLAFLLTRTTSLLFSFHSSHFSTCC